MDHRDLLLTLIEDLLAAPGSRDGWATFLTRLCEALDGTAANFISHDFANSAAGVAVTARTPLEALQVYQEHWHQVDPWAHSPRAGHLKSGLVVAGDALITRGELRRSAFYNDFGRRFDIVQCLAGMIEVTPNRMSVLSINGAERRHPFDDRDVALLQGLMTPLQRALALHRRLEGAELLTLHMSAALDRLPHGVIFVAADGSVLLTNRAADGILRARDGLSSDSDGLRASTVALTTQLRAAIAAAARGPAGAGDAAAGSLRLPKPSGARDLLILAAPLPARRAGLTPAAAAAAVLFVTDPDRAVAPDVDALRSLFGLTPAEAHLVRCLACGLSLEQAAQQLGVQQATVRSRLKTVFQKTNTNRQPDLVRLVISATTPVLG